MKVNRSYPVSGDNNPLFSGGATATEKEHVKEELIQAIGDSQDVLARATTVFPLTIFPDTVTVDRTKITITHRDFFKVGEVVSLQIEDILNITAQVGPFFGSLRISTRFFDPDKPVTVDHLWRDDALRIKRIVQGYLVARQKEIDCNALSTKELAKTLDDLGKVARPEKV